MQENRFKKIILSNDLEEIEDEENDDYTSLTHVYTANNLTHKKNILISNDDSNQLITAMNNEVGKEKNQKKNGFITEKKDKDKNSKSTCVKKAKTQKNMIKTETKKKIYIKKRREGNISKPEISVNNRDNENEKNNEKDKNYTIPKIQEENDSEQKEIIKEIKDSVICYICLMKITSPRICPNCHKIACEKCLKNWFIDKGNNNCGYCRAKLSFDKMISIPIINNVANLIDRISSKKLGMKYAKSNKIKNNFKSVSNITNESSDNNLSEIINNDNVTRNSINIDKFSKLQNKNNEIYLDKKTALISQSTHGPFINKMESEYDIAKEEYCLKHPDQPLYYYCLNCNKAYCRTCFVFFGEEKDKHNNHNIIEYEKYKSINIPRIIKLSNNLDDKNEELKAYIKRCEALKNCYEFEKALVQKHVKKLMDNFNLKIDENIKTLDNIIKNYKFYLSQIEKGQKDIEKFYTKIDKPKLKEYEENLIEKLSNISKIKYYNSKEVDGYSDLPKSIVLNFYQTKLKKYEIKQNNYHFKVPLDNSKYQLAVTQRGDEVQIYIYWPINKDKDINYQEKEKNGLLPFVFMRRKNRNWEYFQLSEFLTFKNNNYYIKRFPTDNFCNINSYFKIKGLLYETYIE